MFLKNFLSGSDSYSLTPTNLDKIKTIKMYDGMYDDLYITRNVEDVETLDIPEAWTDDTIFHAKFRGVTQAGNFGTDMDYVSDILIKRRIKGTNEWTTIATSSLLENNQLIAEGKQPSDFNFGDDDYFVRSGKEYEYAIVSYANGLEGNYDIRDVKCDFNCISVCEKDKVYSTIAEVGACDTTRNGNGSTQELLNRRYPVRYEYGESNYDTIDVSGLWVDLINCCELDFENNIDYMYAFKDFLMDGKAKILKHPDGRIWLIGVNKESGIKDSQEDDVEEKRIISFSATEIGDYNSEKDLYDNGLSDVSREFWSRDYV